MLYSVEHNDSRLLSSCFYLSSTFFYCTSFWGDGSSGGRGGWYGRGYDYHVRVPPRAWESGLASGLLCCPEREPKALRRKRPLRAMAPIQGRTLNIEPLYEEGCFKFWLPRGGNSAATLCLVRYAAYVTSPVPFLLYSTRWTNTLSYTVFKKMQPDSSRVVRVRESLSEFVRPISDPLEHHYMPCCGVKEIVVGECPWLTFLGTFWHLLYFDRRKINNFISDFLANLSTKENVLK